jgi:hypothetical protein
MSEGPDVPAAGTFLREEVVTYPIAEGGGEVSVTPTTSSPFVAPNQNVYVHVKADGSNGEYYDWATAHDAFYKPSGEVIMSSGYEGVTYVDVNGTSYVNGGYTSDIVHDGYGGVMSGGGSTSYYSQGTLINQLTEAVNGEYGGNYYQIGTIDVYYNHDGVGGYSTSNSSPSYYPYGTSVGSYSYTSTEYISDNGWNQAYTSSFGDSYLFSDGMGSVYADGGTGNYAAEGTYIGQNPYTGYYYYVGQYGSYVSSPYPPYGTPTGYTSSGDVYYNIGGTDYVIGSYSCNVYHDGNGSTYDADCGNSYYSYGTYITNYFGYNYYSDGNGGAYSEQETPV